MSYLEKIDVTSLINLMLCISLEYPNKQSNGSQLESRRQLNKERTMSYMEEVQQFMALERKEMGLSWLMLLIGEICNKLIQMVEIILNKLEIPSIRRIKNTKTYNLIYLQMKKRINK